MTSVSLKQLKRIKPEQIDLDHPEREPDFKNHLRHLLQNYPQVTGDLAWNRPKELKARLERVTKRAILQRIILKKEGRLAPDQIEEAVREIVAPHDSPVDLGEEPEPLPEEDELRILAWADNPDGPPPIPSQKKTGTTESKQATFSSLPGLKPKSKPISKPSDFTKSS